MNEYPLIADHGLVGDLQTAALVATDGTLDCYPAGALAIPSVMLSTSAAGCWSPSSCLAW